VAAGFSTVRSADGLGIAEAGQRVRGIDAFRPPVYPLFVAAVTLGHPERTGVAKAADAAVGASSAVLLAALSARLFRRRGVAVATGVLASLHPPFLIAAPGAPSEPLFLLLLLCAGYLLLAATDRPSSNLAVLAGAFLALAALTRFPALALVPLLAAPLFDRRYPRRAGAHLALSAVLGFGLVLAPWAVRDALVSREPVLVGAGLADPRDAALHGACEARDGIWPYADPRFGSRTAAVALGVYLALLCLGAAFGLARAERGGAAAFGVAFLALTLSLHLVFETSGRSRAVSWDPALLLYAVAGATGLLRPRPGPVTA
jgi:hypothetical protein